MVCNNFPVNILGPLLAVTQKVYKGSQVFQNLYSKLSETVRCRANCTNKLSRKYCALGSFSFAKVLQVCHFSGIFINGCSDHTTNRPRHHFFVTAFVFSFAKMETVYLNPRFSLISYQGSLFVRPLLAFFQ